ncbi:hypothetical protein C8Q80DRAFT_1269864 [Daedaleopsis nitida]|nr:hypothetical protein C8Q80DRAFT_1269864 [Daedaleopsis nitida]
MSDSERICIRWSFIYHTVGNQVGDTHCNVSNSALDFYYDNDPGISQYQPYRFWDYSTAKLPFAVKGVVPGGTSFVLNPPRGAKSFEWLANVAAGTVVVMYMEDTNGRQGGVTDFMTVGFSNEHSCLDGHSPSSVINSPSMTFVSATPPASSITGRQTSSESTPTSTSTFVDNPTHRLNTRTLVGAVVGRLPWSSLSPSSGYTFVPLCAAGSPSVGESTPNAISSFLPVRAITLGIASAAHSRHASDSSVGSQTSLSPAHCAPLAGTRTAPRHGLRPLYGGAGTVLSSADDAGALPTDSAASGSQNGTPDVAHPGRDRAQAAWHWQRGVSPRATPAHQRVARVILHTDFEDDPPLALEDEVIELPPQYCERRMQRAGMAVLQIHRDVRPGPQRVLQVRNAHPSDGYACPDSIEKNAR